MFRLSCWEHYHYLIDELSSPVCNAQINNGNGIIQGLLQGDH